MAYESDDGYLPDTEGFAIFWLIKIGEVSADWVRAWSGDGDYAVPADAWDTFGGTYKSIEFPLGIPALTQAVNGASGTLEISVSGVTQEAMALSRERRDEVSGAMVHVGVVDLDQYGAPRGSIDWHFEAVAGTPNQAKDGSGEVAVWSIGIPIATGFVERNDNTQLEFWSANSQRSRSSDDAGADLVAGMSEGNVIAWPN